MKKLIYTIALFGLVVMTACSGDSPSSQPVPTVVPDEWAISSLAVSDPTPDIGATILVDAHVQKNGVDAPNGTSVEFLASGGQFVNGTTEATVSTVSGRAAVQFAAEAAGNYLIQARVRAVTRQVTVSYRDPDDGRGARDRPAAGPGHRLVRRRRDGLPARHGHPQPGRGHLRRRRGCSSRPPSSRSSRATRCPLPARSRSRRP